MVAAVTRTLALLATATALVAAPAPARATGGGADPADAALERAGVQDIVVERRPGLDRGDRAALRADAGVRLEETLTLPETEVVRAAPGELTAALDALNADADVVYAEADAPVHATATDARFAEQWALRNTGQRVGAQPGLADADIDAPEAWSLGASGLGVTVAVVDTGIAFNHPELAGRIATNPGETGGGKETNNVDDDHDGYVDDWQGWDWVAGDNVPADENGHGTHVSGTIAAPQDAVGVAGVAPNARILPLRVLDASGSGSGSAVASAFDLAGRLGIPVVNASLGSSGLSTAQRNAINAHPNTLYVIAAGNDGHNNDMTPTYPCAIPAANIVCVGATDNRDARASFSNVGATSVDLFAPGVGILSTYGAGYGSMSGTSMATPHVAGALALMRQAAPTLNAAQLKQGVLDGADRVPALDGLSVTGARLNAANAIQTVRSVAGLPPLVATDPIPLDPAPVPTPEPVPAPAVPTPGPSPRPTPAPAYRTPVHTRPRLSGLVAAPATAIVCRPRASGCRARAAQLRFRADRATTITAQVQRRACAHGRCAYRTAATVTVDAEAGANRLAIGARGATARLPAGAYRVRLVAADDAGRSAPVAHAVTVKRA
jgi:subtilisin family serine protease